MGIQEVNQLIIFQKILTARSIINKLEKEINDFLSFLQFDVYILKVPTFIIKIQTN